jgi:hypothetical protein
MAAKGYTTAGAVADLLGLTFTAAQEAQADVLIEQVEAYIDRETGRGWLVGTQTAEVHHVGGATILLRYAPVASITTVLGRLGVGEAETTLVADTDYEVMDLENGHLRLIYPRSYDRLRVTYVPVDTVPSDLARAAAEMVAAWLQPTLTPGTFGLDSYSLPDLTVRFARSHVQTTAPPLAQNVIDRYRYGVHA